MGGVIDSFYSDIGKPVIIDKSRGWPIAQIMAAMGQVLKAPPKIIATVRSVPDCMASFVRIAKPDDLDAFIYSGQLADHLRAAYVSLKNGYEFAPECFLFIEYEDLIADPKRELARVHEFLNLDPFNYDFGNIDGSTVSEDDEEMHGYAGMHDVRKELKKAHTDHPKDILKQHYASFCQPEFWLDAPRTLPQLTDLDLQLAASTSGNFAEGWRLAQKLEATEPTNPRAIYNRGWYHLRQGEVSKGYRAMDAGRIAGVFGNASPDTHQPKWDGRSKGTILLQLEGGLGDQIHQVRYARMIADRGCSVVVSCTGQLAALFRDVYGVSAVIQHGAEYGIYHDAYVPGMSAPLYLGIELGDLSGKPYIETPRVIKGVRQRIGLRWQGAAQFEHEHHKRFPAQLMFDAVKGIDADFISLQRDEGAEFCPPWVQQSNLSNWIDTQKAVASCDLVITACTSVSHLAGAMGIKTWLVTPIMPYYLYAMEGETTPYYDSFTIFRQAVFGDWEAPFQQIAESLKCGF